MARLSYADFLKNLDKSKKEEPPATDEGEKAPAPNEADPDPNVTEAVDSPAAEASESKPEPEPPVSEPVAPKTSVESPKTEPTAPPQATEKPKSKEASPTPRAPEARPAEPKPAEKTPPPKRETVTRPAPVKPEPTTVKKTLVPGVDASKDTVEKEHHALTGAPTRAKGSRGASLPQHQLVCFQLGGEEYAIDIMEVEEIFETKNIHPLPNQPRYILGITKVRNRTVPVIDLAQRMGLRVDKDRNYPFLMIVSIKNETLGLAVEKVTEVRLLQKGVIEAAPSLPKSGESDYFDGIYVIDGKLLIVLRVERILTKAEIADLAQAIKDVRKNFSTEENVRGKREPQE